MDTRRHPSRTRLTQKVLALLATFAFALSLIIPTADAQRRARARRADAREEAYRANNLGVALLEQFMHREGAEEFRRALRLNPNLTLARINLAIALFNIPDLDAARAEAEAASRLAPEAPQPHYILGLIARAQNRTEEAAEHFRRVLEIDPRDVGSLVNLGQLQAQRRDYTSAVSTLRAAVAEEPYNGTALYNLGTALLRSGAREEGQRTIERFQSLRQSGAATVTGQNYLEQGRYAEAVASTGAETDLVDTRTPRVRFREETARVIQHALSRSPAGEQRTRNYFEESARDALAARFSAGPTPFDFDNDGDLDLLDAAPERLSLYRNTRGVLTEVTDGAGALAQQAQGVNVGAVAGDYDNDGLADLFVLRYGRSALYRNEGGGRFSDRTSAAGLPAYTHLSISAAFVDADHDGDLDIVVAGFADLRSLKVEPLLGRDFPANLENSTRFSGQAEMIARTTTPAPNLLLRNNGDGTFKDITAEAGLGSKGRAVAIIPTDFDNRRDVDLLFIDFDSPPALYRNMRDGTFRNVAAEVGLKFDKYEFNCAAAGDINKDGFTDFYFGRALEAGAFAVSDGRGRFVVTPAPEQREGLAGSTRAGEQCAAQLLDYDNDGLLDLVTVSSKDSNTELRVLRNVGRAWNEVTGVAAPALLAPRDINTPPLNLNPRSLASGDFDEDGDIDLLVRESEGRARYFRSTGGEQAGAVRLRLAGKVSNRSGVGAKLEMRAGSLRQRLETYSASPAPAPSDVVFGLGGRGRADAVRVLWPAGIVQAETNVAPRGGSGAVKNVASLTITELDRKPSSCPYLFTWNGEHFEFVTDFLGGGELGYWAAPGVRAAPDPDEYVRIRGDQLKPRAGRYELRVTNELEEALFLDHLQLVAVDHPAGVDVYPNEGLGNPTSSTFKLYTARSPRPPAAATDQHGHDVLQKISRIDRKYPDDFRLFNIRGYAEEHALTINLVQEPGRQGSGAGGRGPVKADAASVHVKGASPSYAQTSINKTIQHPAPDPRPLTPAPAPDSRPLLLLTGWTDYAFSSDNVAASQSGLSLKAPSLQVRDTSGRWRTVIENIGIPVGRPQTVVVDLEGKFLSASREVRLVTNMRIYWDQILVAEREAGASLRLTRLEAKDATLRWRGYSAELTPDGREPFGYDYTRVSAVSPWKVMPGSYTREGEVRELLAEADDMFIVSRTGDEIAVSFDAAALPPLPEGWARTFLLYSDGFSKEMDLNSASPDQVAPLPFHLMRNYPYGEEESYPTTPAHRAYIEQYNTRVVRAPVGGIEALLTMKRF